MRLYQYALYIRTRLKLIYTCYIVLIDLDNNEAKVNIAVTYQL